MTEAIYRVPKLTLLVLESGKVVNVLDRSQQAVSLLTSRVMIRMLSLGEIALPFSRIHNLRHDYRNLSTLF